MTPATSAPPSAARLSDSRNSGVSAWICTPSQPRVTDPLSRSCAMMFFAMLIGIAKPIPCPEEMMAELIPTTSPRALNSGPPLLPGLIEASVWMKAS